MSDRDIAGADAEVIADTSTGKVVTRYLYPEGHPRAGEMVVEIHIGPDTARELAFNLTRASIAIEEAAL